MYHTLNRNHRVRLKEESLEMGAELQKDPSLKYGLGFPIPASLLYCYYLQPETEMN